MFCINGLATEFWQQDVAAVVSAGVEVVRIPMTESVEDVMTIDAEIEKIEKECGREVGSTKIMVAIETALGVMNCFNIAKSPTRD